MVIFFKKNGCFLNGSLKWPIYRQKWQFFAKIWPLFNPWGGELIPQPIPTHQGPKMVAEKWPIHNQKWQFWPKNGHLF